MQSGCRESTAAHCTVALNSLWLCLQTCTVQCTVQHHAVHISSDKHVAQEWRFNRAVWSFVLGWHKEHGPEYISQGQWAMWWMGVLFFVVKLRSSIFLSFVFSPSLPPLPSSMPCLSVAHQWIQQSLCGFILLVKLSVRGLWWLKSCLSQLLSCSLLFACLVLGIAMASYWWDYLADCQRIT